MRSPILLAVAFMFVAGCMIVFENDNDDDPGTCDLPQPEPAFTLIRNPETLACEPFDAGFGCDPRCGPCPAVYSTPRWGLCESGCEQLDEAACTKTARCRVIKNAYCIGGVCGPDFVGCVATSFIGNERAIDCFSARTGDQCSESDTCTAWHRAAQTLAPQEVREFAVCAPEGATPGRCTGEVLCDRLPVKCPSTHTPGIANGCYTGACIPTDLCEPGRPRP